MIPCVGGAICIDGIIAMASKKDAASAGVNVLVTVAEPHRDKLDAVADRLESAGMAVAEKFRLGGIIAGEVPRNKLGALRKISEVSTVEEEPTFRSDV
jgi:hypothetical protein